ncbi:MAG: 4-hydroxythreonine-4-phosphate dehydrogenase PdxA [Bacteroidia bacterium]
MSNNNNHKLRIGITIGDISGIGPELVLKAFQDQRLKDQCIPILYGSSKVLNIYRKALEINKFNYHIVQKASQSQSGRLNLIEIGDDSDRFEIGKPSEAGALIAYQALKSAIEDAQHQEIDALVTLPVDKSLIEQHHPGFTGHTEMLAQAFNVDDNLMLMVWDNLRVGLVTNHVPVQDVARNLSRERIVRKVMLLNESLLYDFDIPKPMIAVLGLNPHAGDNGLIGKEEEKIILPAIEELKSKGVFVAGPYPADGFFGSMTYKRFDGVMAMYHDQGLTPFKLLAGYEGVNFTAGIPLVRTSPDHGVAFDIAGKNIADPASLCQSMYLAMDVFRSRTENAAIRANALVPGKNYVRERVEGDYEE